MSITSLGDSDVLEGSFTERLTYTYTKKVALRREIDLLFIDIQEHLSRRLRLKGRLVLSVLGQKLQLPSPGYSLLDTLQEFGTDTILDILEGGVVPIDVDEQVDDGDFKSRAEKYMSSILACEREESLQRIRMQEDWSSNPAEAIFQNDDLLANIISFMTWASRYSFAFTCRGALIHVERHYIATGATNVVSCLLPYNLTEADRLEIEHALSRLGAANEVITRSVIGGIPITRASMRTLAPQQWLNDEVIHATLFNLQDYINKNALHDEHEGSFVVKALPSGFLPRLLVHGNE